MPELTHLQIAALYAALNAIIALMLSLNVGRVRWKTHVLLGDGDNEDLRRAMRVHANNVEYVPFAIILLVLLALLQSSIYVLHGVGAVLTIARIFHAVGLGGKSGVSVGRIVGANLTLAAMIAEIVVLLMKVFA